MSRKAFQLPYDRKILSEISELNVRALVLETKPCDPEAKDKLNASKLRLKALYNYYTRTKHS